MYDDTGFCHNYRHRSVICMTEKKIRSAQNVTDVSFFVVYLAENRLSFPSATRWVRHSYLSKGLRLIPYTCGSSRLFSGAVAGE